MSLIKRNFPAFPSFSDLFGEDWITSNWPEVSWSPAVNVIENGDKFEVEVAAPGLKKDEFDISVEILDLDTRNGTCFGIWIPR